MMITMIDDDHDDDDHDDDDDVEDIHDVWGVCISDHEGPEGPDPLGNEL